MSTKNNLSKAFPCNRKAAIPPRPEVWGLLAEFTINSKDGFVKKTTKGNGKGNDKRSEPWSPSTRDMQLYFEYAKGSKSQKQVGVMFNLAQSRVNVIVNKINRWLWLETMDDIRLVKMQQVQSLTYVYREAMRAWERSKGFNKTLMTKRSKESVEKTRTVKHHCGEAKYLEIALKTLEDIRKITGANAPIEIRHSGELRVAGLSLEDAYKAKIRRLNEGLELLGKDSRN